MWRSVLEPAAFFAAPFAAYAVYLVLRRRLALSAWSRMTVSVLTLAGLAAAALGVLALGVIAPRHQGAYIPAHVENGKVVPGRFE